MEKERNFYLVKLTTDAGKRLLLRIGRARPGVTASEAKAALQALVEANALNPDFGRLTGATDLQYLTVARTPLDVA